MPVAVGASRDWRLRSWDGFRIPKPGAQVVVGFGEPVRVPARADQATRETARKELEASLGALAERIDAEALR